MKTKLNISKSKNTMILIMGILTALTILSGQIYNTQFSPSIELSQDSNSNDADDQQQTIVRTVDAVSTTAHVNLIHQFYFITEILYAEENHKESTYFELPKLNTFFTTLFRQIISSNAP